MFDSLSDTMREDAKRETKTSERVLFWIAVTVGSVVLFGGLVIGTRFLG
jgi:hypothetical protein